jgi:hypothetical protein
VGCDDAPFAASRTPVAGLAVAFLFVLVLLIAAYKR